nr:PREDICTED: uncharacterized protein LOC109039664 [Bemisia tabaci]
MMNNANDNGSTDDGSPSNSDADSIPTFEEMMQHFRVKLRRHHILDDCSAPNHGRSAKLNCRDALDAFDNLTVEERAVCPDAKSADCRQCGFILCRCTFMCRPTEQENLARLRRFLYPSRVFKCKPLRDIVRALNLA